MSNPIVKGWLAVIELAVDLAVNQTRDPSNSVDECARAMSAKTAAGDTLIARMAERFALSPRDELAFWCLVAHQIDSRIGGRLEALGGGQVNLAALALTAYGGVTHEAVEALGERGALRRNSLIEATPTNKSTWAQRIVRVTDRMLGLALGEADGPTTDCCLIEVAEDDVAVRDATVPLVAVEALAVTPEAVRAGRNAMRVYPALVVASGMPGSGRRSLLAALAAEAGMRVAALDARKLSRERAVLAQQIRDVARECRLHGRVLLLANIDALADDKDDRLEFVGAELEARLSGTILTTCGARRPTIRWDRPTLVVELGPPSAAQHAALWLRALDAGAASDGEVLATRYPLAPALIMHASAIARARASDRDLTETDVREGIRTACDDRLHAFAHRVNVTQTWDDLVLPQEQLDAITELRARIRDRRRVYEQWGFATKLGKGLGVSALFSGLPGTGKTMAAALIAHDLGLELYQVDLGKIVSKWIGETEKNLGALFDAAEAGNAVLLFDEADSLFGKRTEVRSSNDRHANQETNYLLQRLESFTGTCMLTSNHESSIDPAFMRRLSMHLRFVLPDLPERARLWAAMLPSAAPVDPHIDFHLLAKRYEMSGGYIRNAALRAAFLASDGETQITTPLLDRAASLEYVALGKLG